MGVDNPLRIMHAFFISSFFITNARLILVKIKQILSNTLRLKFCYLKIVDIFHSRFHPKIIVHILKNKQKTKYVCENEDENEK